MAFIMPQMELRRMSNSKSAASVKIGSLLTLIRDNIDSGAWPSGSKLPTERELEQKLGVSRNTLRKGLRRLEQDGRIIRHVGRGSFVADHIVPVHPTVSAGPPHVDLGIAAPDRLEDQIKGASPVEIMEFRLMIEPAAVELAAHRATSADLDRMEYCLHRMDEAAEILEYEVWDGMLHVAIVAAAKNDLLLAMYRILNETRSQPEWEMMKRKTVTPERRNEFRSQHRAIVDALCKRDAVIAKREMLNHIRQVRNNLLEY